MANRDEELEALGVRLADEVNTLVIRPGDTLVVAMERRITTEEFERMSEYLRDFVPELKVLILPEAGDIRVYRPDGERM